jgi:hypothetical protein
VGLPAGCNSLHATAARTAAVVVVAAAAAAAAASLQGLLLGWLHQHCCMCIVLAVLSPINHPGYILHLPGTELCAAAVVALAGLGAAVPATTPWRTINTDKS